MTRYAHQTGHHVTRRFGWDTHGLPIEFEIDKEFGVKTREDVLNMGIPTYNEHCRSIVMRYAKDWEVIVSRLGRWIDFENDYKTLDTTFMESIWWVFKQLYEKNLVYRGFKVRNTIFEQTQEMRTHKRKDYEHGNIPLGIWVPLLRNPPH